jgi:hypothetical protein
MDTTLMTLAQSDEQERVTPLAAFERLCLEIVQLEALANAASAAMDGCSPPSAGRRSFDRARALLGAAAEQSTTAVALCEALNASVRLYIANTR